MSQCDSYNWSELVMKQLNYTKSMGNKSSCNPHRQAAVCLEVRNIVSRKHKEFPQLKIDLLEEISRCTRELKQSKHIKELTSIVKGMDSRECTIPFHELESYLIANLQTNFINGKEFLKSKRKEFFSFARQNLLKNSEFVMARVIRQLNYSAKDRLEVFNTAQLQQLLSLAMHLTKIILKWFYGFRIFTGLSPIDEEDTNAMHIFEMYLSELAECLLYFERSERNYLFKLRFKLIEHQTLNLDSEIVSTVRQLRTVENKRIETLFPRDDETSYNIILEYLEKLAQVPLLTTKFKFICIIVETIPALFLQSEFRRYHKQSSAAKRTFCMTPERNYSTMNQHTFTGSFQNYELENAYSQLLSTDNKRELMKYLLIEWFKKSKYCIIQDVYLPLVMLLSQGYVDRLDENITLATFMHALFEVVGVEADMNEEMLEESIL